MPAVPGAIGGHPPSRQTLLLVIFTLLSLGGCTALDKTAATPGGADNRYAWQDTNNAQTQAASAESAPAADSDYDIEPTVVEFEDYKDPLIGFNRAIFSFNDASYRYALIPLAKGYTSYVPNPVRTGISNFYYNIKAPVYVVNNTLQLKPKAAGVNLLRFGINTTLGLLGFFDPAKAWFDLEKADTGFSDTFAHYGVGYGVYLVLPILGPSDLRSGTSALAEGFLHPIRYLVDNPERTVIQGVDYFQEFAPQAERYTALADESEDPYIFFRNLYLQGIQRDAAYE